MILASYCGSIASLTGEPATLIDQGPHRPVLALFHRYEAVLDGKRLMEDWTEFDGADFDCYLDEEDLIYIVPGGQGFDFAVRVVLKGMHYGRNFCLTLGGGEKPSNWSKSDEPLVEFYDTRYRHAPWGQFVSRYCLSTLMERDRTRGLNLHGGTPSWSINSSSMALVHAWLEGLMLGRGIKVEPDDFMKDFKL